LIELFKLEVPEVGQASQHPGGARTRAYPKIAVRQHDSARRSGGSLRRHARFAREAVSNEIAGERVDIIPFDDNNAQFVINAMAPAEVTSIVVDEDSHSMDIAVRRRSLASHRPRRTEHPLASELTGWELNVMSESQAEAKRRDGVLGAARDLMKQLDVDADVASILVRRFFDHRRDCLCGRPAN